MPISPRYSQKVVTMKKNLGSIFTHLLMFRPGDAITCKKNDPLHEWKLAQFNGDALQWLEWYDQFQIAVNSQSLTDDVKLTYLKTIVSGKAKIAISEFAYCGLMFKEKLRILECKFG